MPVFFVENECYNTLRVASIGNNRANFEGNGWE